MKTFKQFIFEATHVSLYPNGVGSDISNDDEDEHPTHKHPVNKTVGNEPFKDTQYFRRPSVKKHVNTTRKNISKGNSTPVLATSHPEHPEHNVVVDGNHRLQSTRNARRDNISTTKVPHSHVHLLNTDDEENPTKHSLSSFQDKHGNYDMDRPRKRLGGKTLRHYFVNSDGSHNFNTDT